MNRIITEIKSYDLLSLTKTELSAENELSSSDSLSPLFNF